MSVGCDPSHTLRGVSTSAWSLEGRLEEIEFVAGQLGQLVEPWGVREAGDKGAEADASPCWHAGLASDIEITAAFGCHRKTVAHLAGRLAHEGRSAVVPAKRGPRVHTTAQVTADLRSPK